MDFLLLIQNLSVAGAFFFTFCLLGLTGFVGSLFIHAIRHPAARLGK